MSTCPTISTYSSTHDVSDIVLVDVAERVATVTLNRPEVRNALNGELIETIRTRLTSAKPPTTSTR